MPTVSKKRTLRILHGLVERCDTLGDKKLGEPVFTEWHNDAMAAARNIFGEGSVRDKSFAAIKFAGNPFLANEREWFLHGLSTAKAMLSSMAAEVFDFWPNDETSSSTTNRKAASGRDVFIIHGRNLDLAEVVARFVDKRGLNAVILHEKPNKGRTIIEKFEQNAMPCAFAIALLTADDEGRLRNSDEDLHHRARQNVILELGYFHGALGRDRVAVLHDETVELPSDYDGVIYIPINGGAWKAKLDTELDAAGLVRAEPAARA